MKKRNYKKEYEYHKTAIQKKRRAERNKARRKAEKEGKVKKGDNMDVDHPTRNTASTKTRVISRSKNRSHGGKVGSKKGKAKGGRKKKVKKKLRKS